MTAMAQIQFGAKIGVDATHFWGKDTEHGMKIGYQFGALMEYKFNPNFAIAPEVVFASQGGKFKIYEVGNKKVDNTFTTNYINVPVMFKWYATPNFSLDLGPQVGFNVYSKYKVGDLDAEDIKDATKSVDFGVGLGGTYNLTDNAFIQARYTMGLTDAFKGELNEAKNGNIQIAFGMKF